MYTPDGISRAFKEKGVRADDGRRALLRMRSKSPPHVSPSAAIPCIYTADSSCFVSICCRRRRRPGRRRRQGQRQKQRHQQQTCRREKIALPPNNKGKKKHNGHASLHCYWAAPNGLNRCGYLQPGRSPNKKKNKTITISLFFRWTACNTSILSRPFASAANKRIFHLCFKRINGPAPLDWIIVDQLRDEIPLPSLLCTTSVYLFISGSGEEHFNCGI